MWNSLKRINKVHQEVGYLQEMKIISSISNLPQLPLVMYGERDQKHVAYMGIGGSLWRMKHIFQRPGPFHEIL